MSGRLVRKAKSVTNNFFLSILGYKDGFGSTVRFSDPQGCTAFGDGLAIADNNNHAVRIVTLDLHEVTTIVRKGGGGFADGVYTGSAYSGAGIYYPVFIEALNTSHLIVVHNTGQVRLIDTVNKMISTLISGIDVSRLLLF